MITGLQLAVLSGGLIGLGLALVVARLLPAEPDLADALLLIGEQLFLCHDALAFEDESHEMLSRHGADEQVPLPLRKHVARVEHHP